MAPMLPPSSICFPFPTFSACTLTKTSANLAKVVRIRAYTQFSLPFSSDIKSHMFSHVLLAFRSRPLLPRGSGHLCPGGQWKPGAGGRQVFRAFLFHAGHSHGSCHVKSPVQARPKPHPPSLSHSKEGFCFLKTRL